MSPRSQYYYLNFIRCWPIYDGITMPLEVTFAQHYTTIVNRQRMSDRKTLHGDEFTINFMNAPIKFRNEEGIFYSRIFYIVDMDSDGLIGGVEGSWFLRRAKLSNEANREIWRLASGGKSQDKLNKDCCLYLGEALPLADFQLNESPDDAMLEVCKQSALIEEGSFTITVSSPICVGMGYTRYTQYVVSTKADSSHFPLPFSQVKRRYSDFEWLHQRLHMRFKGTIIPPLPEKRWTGNMDATFVEERRQALEFFINEVCHHIKLSQTLELQIILTGSIEGLIAGKELLKVGSVAAKFIPTASSMSSLWTSLRDVRAFGSSAQQIEIETDDEYTKIGEYIKEYQQRIQQVQHCSDAVYAAQRAEGYEMSRFGNFLSALVAYLKDDKEMQSLFQVTGDLFDYVSNLYQDQLDNVLATYVSVIHYQTGKIGAVKTVMNNRETAIIEVQRANISMQRNKERFAAARASSGAAASAMRAEQNMASAEDRMNHAKEQVQFIANSLKHESKRMDNGMTINLRSALLSLAHLQKDYHIQAREAWEGLIPMLDLSPAIVEESRSKALSIVTYRKPGDENPSKIIGFL